MSKPLVISPKECQGLTWQPPANYAFAANQALLPLHAGELAKAAATMPLALVKEAGEWRLVAVCGLTPNHNLFIREGKWLGNYTPSWLASWPFYTMEVGDKSVVLFDRESGLVGQGDEPFFDQQGQPAPSTQKAVQTLTATAKPRRMTQKALAALAKAGVMTPWPETLRHQLGIELEGLYMIDERALSQLEDSAFLALRQQHALPIAYAVNFSIQQAHLLVRLARLNPGTLETPQNLDEVFDNDDDFTFTFDD